MEGGNISAYNERLHNLIVVNVTVCGDAAIAG